MAGHLGSRRCRIDSKIPDDEGLEQEAHPFDLIGEQPVGCRSEGRHGERWIREVALGRSDQARPGSEPYAPRLLIRDQKQAPEGAQVVLERRLGDGIVRQPSDGSQ